MKNIIVALSVAFCVLSFSGCVRLTGTAGYSKTDAEGETTYKKASFDTNQLILSDQASGDIAT